MRIQRHWRCSLFLFAILLVLLCTMTALVFPRMEKFWLQPMVPHCSGYVLILERFWIQLRKPMTVCPIINSFSCSLATYKVIFYLWSSTPWLLFSFAGDISCISWSPKAIPMGKDANLTPFLLVLHLIYCVLNKFP